MSIQWQWNAALTFRYLWNQNHRQNRPIWRLMQLTFLPAVVMIKGYPIWWSSQGSVIKKRRSTFLEINWTYRWMHIHEEPRSDVLACESSKVDFIKTAKPNAIWIMMEEKKTCAKKIMIKLARAPTFWQNVRNNDRKIHAIMDWMLTLLKRVARSSITECNMPILSGQGQSWGLVFDSVPPMRFSSGQLSHNYCHNLLPIPDLHCNVYSGHCACSHLFFAGEMSRIFRWRKNSFENSRDRLHPTSNRTLW